MDGGRDDEFDAGGPPPLAAMRPVHANHAPRRRHPLTGSIRGAFAGVYVQAVCIAGIVVIDRAEFDKLLGTIAVLAIAFSGWLVLVGPAGRDELSRWCRNRFRHRA